MLDGILGGLRNDEAESLDDIQSPSQALERTLVDIGFLEDFVNFLFRGISLTHG